MKHLIIGILIVTFTNLSLAQVAQTPAADDFKEIMDSVQAVMDQHNIDCKFKMQPVRNIVRLLVNDSFKINGSCEGKQGTKISSSLKLQGREKSTVIKNLTIKLENLEIP